VSEPPDEARDDLEGCTAVLVTVPEEVAHRLQAFLLHGGFACRIRPTTTELAGAGAASQEVARAPDPGVGLAEGYDVLVRPEDLPLEAGVVPEVPEVIARSDANATEPPVELCQLPWDQAWALIERLGEAGIAAAVLAPETVARDVPMADRIVPVGVRAEHLERARGFVQG
jgi:hypothetical protein